MRTLSVTARLSPNLRAWLPFIVFLACTSGSSALAGEDLITAKRISMEFARDIAQSAVEACREGGYQVSVVIVDRGANPQVIMRDDYAARFTMDIAEGKANAAVLAGISTREFNANAPEITRVLNQVPGVIALGGGVPIRAAGSLVGAIGVSGAPGPELDEACALKALENVAERLEFAD